MNKYQKKIAKAALKKYKELKKEIYIPIKGTPYSELNVEHPRFKEFFFKKSTIRKYKSEIKKQLREA